jgi:nicotinamide mononucleotide (NMN) deamidase PncC
LFSAEAAALDPTSRELAERMAADWREMTGADFALAIGGFPELASSEAPPNRVHLALASAAGVEIQRVPYAGQPSFLRRRTAKQGLNLVRLRLLD